MRKLPRSARSLAALAAGVLLLVALIAAYHGVRVGRTRATVTQATAQQKVVFVTFEGPWAFARDPNDANSVFAFAPKTNTHRDLVVHSSESKTLGAGIYELSLPAARSSAPSIDPNVLQAKIDAQGVQHALSAKSER